MIPASVPIQRPPDARLLIVDSRRQITETLRSDFPNLLRAGDVVIANDAATLPASLAGIHLRSGRAIEVRLAASKSLGPNAIQEFSAVVFGEGDYQMPTEKRPSPPELHPGDELQLGPLTARVLKSLGHRRLVLIRFEGTVASIWEGLARHGRPIQYSYLSMPLVLWDMWTPIAGPPVAFEPPSASFTLDWSTVDAIRARGAHFGTFTHSAGISSTGDAELDSRLPFDEPYRIPDSTARSIRAAQTAGGRVIAIGTTVVRALEHSFLAHGTVRASTGLANNKIGRETELRAVNAILTGTHEPGSSHYELLRAFIDDHTLQEMDRILNERGYRTHEFGDSIFAEKSGYRPGLQDRDESLGQQQLVNR